METPKSSEILQLCAQHFPGLDWETKQDSDDLATQYQEYTAAVWGWPIRLSLVIQVNGALMSVSIPSRVTLMRSLNEQGQTPEQALGRVKELWMEYCQAMTGVLHSKK